ncbi:Myoviridae tail sheath stabiliser [uncultured Caudovirales phage]|uniref:Myoviridae tail sheath stabiliser n=1 Tax=uncultured Caudovirales phage TaxID=2100421 RepID=A0A6J5L8B5_9CAUD|nr:Myoviridae tail sheath stabiliser [uncultured Caudovirales phage]
MAQTFFYSGQIRRYLLQFSRVMGNFQVEFNTNGTSTLQQVPIKYGDSSRQASHIMRNASENTIMGVVPMMSYYISGLDYDRSRIQEPSFVSNISVRQREYNHTTKTYGAGEGDAFTVERLMPVPYKLTIKLDIWTSNLNQKLQLLEQIGVLFNPSLEIQNTDNFIDWTSLSVVELTGTTFTSRVIPVGTEDQIDISTMTFELPVWLSAPAKIKKLGIVEKLVNSIYNDKGDLDAALFNQDFLNGTRKTYVPMDFGVVLIDNQLQLIKQLGSPGAIPYSWAELLKCYDPIVPGISQIQLANPATGVSAVGTITLNPTDASMLVFSIDIDSIPVNTLPPFNAIIDPLVSGPGVKLPAASEGVRYLLLSSIGNAKNSSGPNAWKSETGADLIASKYDIIEYRNKQWVVAFRSSVEKAAHVTNLTTGVQYAWDGVEWRKSYMGEYGAGTWMLVI